LKEIVVPLVVEKLKGLDSKIEDDIMPKIEDLIFRIFNTIEEKTNTITSNKHKKGAAELNEALVRDIVKEQFNDALTNVIVPKLEEVLKNMLN
jgi:hypothetical protein